PVAWPRWVEAGLVAAAIAALLPWFDRVAVDDLGRDRRFADAAIGIHGLPEPTLPSLCVSYGGAAEPLVRDRLCRGADIDPAVVVERMPRLLAEARARTTAAFLAPQREAENRVAALRLQQREGLGDLLALGNGIDAIERELVPFIKHYQLDGGEGAGPRPLACAFQAVESTLATSTSGAAGAQGRLARANAVLLLGAALDGHGATGPLADVALLPVVSMAGIGRCAGAGLTDALAQGAALMADARHAPVVTIKHQAMRALLHSGGWQWAGWVVVSL